MKTFVISLLVISLVAGVAIAKKPQEVPIGVAQYVGSGGSRQGGEDIATAYVIPGLPFNDTGTTVGYLDDYDITGSDGLDVVYTFTPATDMFVNIALCGSLYDTKLAVLLDDLTEYAYNDDGCFARALQSDIADLALTGGVNYHIIVDGYGAAAGEYELLVEEVVPVADPDCEAAITAVEGLNSCPGAPFWYTFTAPIDGCIWIDSCLEEQLVDTRLYVDSDCFGTNLGFNDDLYDECAFYNYSSFLSVPVSAGDVLYIFWDDYWTDVPFDFNLWVTDCVVNSENTNWGSIKSLYR